MINNEQRLKIMKNALKEYKDLRKNNPEEAKKLSKQNLIKTGIINEQGNICAPYNRIFKKDIEMQQ